MSLQQETVPNSNHDKDSGDSPDVLNVNDSADNVSIDVDTSDMKSERPSSFSNQKMASVDDEKKSFLAPINSSNSSPAAKSNNNTMHAMIAFCGVVTLMSLIALIALAFKEADNNSQTITVVAQSPEIVVNAGSVKYATMKGPEGVNPCDGKKPDLPNKECIVNSIANVNPQSGANVTQGYQGLLQVDYSPITTPFWQAGMCAVNVHWHVGTEHYSVGEFDENGSGPKTTASVEEERPGFQCHLYNETDRKFTAPYNWEHCHDLQVGETYEVHWPHSAAGACGTLDQFQTPFYDGVFCRDNVITETAQQIGVQAQIFTIVNDEKYYYPDLMRGMIVDGTYGQDIAKYTGSTTGTSVDNEICSQFSPITWQVDRKCHLVSASSFDKMCADMKAQRDDMSDDLHPHGSRELVKDELVANNFSDRKRQLMRKRM